MLYEQVKRLAMIATAILLLSGPAFAQDKPDPKLGVAMQLLNERSGQVIDLAAQVQTLGQQNQELRAENAKLKAEQKK